MSLFRVKTRNRFSSMLLIVVVAVAAVVSSAVAAPPAPQFMPGFPLMAGNVVMIMWAPVPGATKYKIYLNNEVKGEVPAPPFQLETPSKSGEYSIEIAAVGGDGVEGARSRPGTFKIVKLEPPKEINARVSEGKVFLQWTAPPGASIYNIFRSVGSEKDYKLLESVQDTKFSDSKVEKGKVYFYAITSKDVTGKESERSPVAKVEISKEAEKAEAGRQYPIKLVKSERVLTIASTLEYDLAEVSDLLYLDGKIYAVDEGKGNIKAFNMDGEGGVFIPNGREDGKVYTPSGIGKGPNGTIAVAEGLSRVVKIFSKDGALVLKMDLPPMPKEWPEDMKQYYTRMNINGSTYDVDTAPNGHIYVVDQGWSRVVEYDANGKFLANHGKRGEAKGDFQTPNKILALPDGRVLVGEQLGRRVQVFDSSFKVVDSFGSTSDWVGAFLGITGISAAGDGRIVCVDGPMYTIQYFDTKKFDYLFHVAGEKMELDQKMEKQRPLLPIGYPVGVAVDGKGRIWIGNPQEKRILVLNIAGTP